MTVCHLCSRCVAGVDGRGLPEMQAQLYKLEQQAATKKASGQSLAKPRRVPAGALGAANTGVDSRNEKDLRDAPVRYQGHLFGVLLL